MTGIYIHIPFCAQKCSYCNFHFSTQLSQTDAMIQAIVSEIELRQSEVHSPIQTLYFGGGTPSLISSIQLGKIFEKLHSLFNLQALQEVTLECNPDDIHLTKLQVWKALGINRLSIGVQSFLPEDLHLMNRSHTVIQAKKSIELAQDNDFTNLTIDLIYGSPSSSEEVWRQNLSAIQQYHIPHFSAYALTIEPKTALAHKINIGKLPEISEERQYQDFKSLQNFAKENQYEQYEVSNFALEHHRAIHNSNYWQGRAYIGFGPSAHSYDGQNTRSFNLSHNTLYIQSIAAGKTPLTQEILKNHEKYNELIMIGLRSVYGVSENEIHQFPSHLISHFKKTIQPYIEQQKIYCFQGKYQLNPDYYFQADGIASDLFWVEA